MELTISEKFRDVLSMMDDKIAHFLTNLTSEAQYNFIDSTEQNDLVSFSPTSKIKEFLGNKPKLYILTSDRRNLTHSDSNDYIFENLGYDKTKGDMWKMGGGDLVQILGEAVSNTGKTYAFIQKYESSELAVINKKCLSEHDDYSFQFWSKWRNNIKVGRLVRTILMDVKYNFVDKDIEIFTNKYKATFDFMRDETKRFDIVSGEDIAKWYKKERYDEGEGVLNHSCMGGVDSKLLDIYTKNKQVSMIVLYGDNGLLKDDQYICDKIKGRAILWDAEINGESVKFMDRVYTKNDSDVELFKKFAISNNIHYKEVQSRDTYTTILLDGKPVSDKVVIKLDSVDFSYFPYIDTVCYCNTNDKTLSNHNINYDRIFRSTCGSYDQYNLANTQEMSQEEMQNTIAMEEGDMSDSNVFDGESIDEVSMEGTSPDRPNIISRAFDTIVERISRI